MRWREPQSQLTACLVAAMAFALGACADGPVEPGSYQINGGVTLEGEPAPGLLVTATFDDANRAAETTVTDAEGLYAFPIDSGDNFVQVTVSVAPPSGSPCDPPSERITLTRDSPEEEANFSCFGRAIDQVVVSPGAFSLLANHGETVDFGVTVLNDHGTPLTTVDVVGSSSTCRLASRAARVANSW